MKFKKVASLAYWFGIPLSAYLAARFFIQVGIGDQGLIGTALEHGALWKIALGWMVMTHLTITAMSLCFHRMHTHQGVRLHPAIDSAMQVWLWFTTSMSKLDWVSVHVYHHTHSDQDLDPHSPVKKGLAHVFFLGVVDYVRAKSLPDVLRIRKRIPENRLEAFISKHLFLGPILWTFGMMVLFGPAYGALFALMTFLISPIFAVGGVNALAHYFGYRNHKTTDNSRNLGFVFVLNWMICGELDHNNHHAYPKSCSFRHRWYELDIGYVYITLLSALGLAKPMFVYKRKRRPVAAAAPIAPVAVSAPAMAELEA